MNALIFIAVASVTFTLCSSFSTAHRSLAQRVMTRESNSILRAAETDDEMRERLRKKMRKNLFNENGVAFAPWVTKNMDEDAILEDLMKKEKGLKVKVKSSTLDRGELETSEGMRWRQNENGQVDLAWITGTENNNIGFLVEKRPSYGGGFAEVASFREVAQLKSKGAQGGKYTYSDPSTAPGSWIYRVQDCDATGNTDVLCQCFVEVQAQGEAKGQVAVLAGLVAVLTGLAAVGFVLDAPK